MLHGSNSSLRMRNRHFQHQDRIYFDHVCHLVNFEPELPCPAPFASFSVKFRYHIGKWMLINAGNHHTKRFFRSRYAIHREKFRQLSYCRHHYIIHPLSQFQAIREIIVFFLLQFVIVGEMLQNSYLADYLNDATNDNSFAIDCILFICNLALLFDLWLNFYTGFMQDNGREIVLNLQLIQRGYIRTYFLFDLIPILYGVVLFCFRNSNVHKSLLALPFNYFRLARLYTMWSYLSRFLQIFKIRHIGRRAILIMVITFNILHTFNCVLCFVITANYHFTRHNDNSHMISIMSNMNRSTLNVYIEGLLLIVIHFFGAGRGNFDSPNKTENLLLAFTLLLGFAFQIFVTALYLQVFDVMSVSETMFEELVHQMNHYMDTKQLPLGIRKRVRIYFDYRYQGSYFKEKIILATLSEHLRCEVLLHSHHDTLERLWAFRGASRSSIGTALSMFEEEVYLPNDMILESDRGSDGIYFIRCGTVAVFLKSGLEYMHYEDGAHFGEVTLLLKTYNANIGSISVQAIETTQVLYMSRSALKYWLDMYPEVAKRLLAVAVQKRRKAGNVHHFELDRQDDGGILSDLRYNRILDQRIKKGFHFDYR